VGARLGRNGVGNYTKLPCVPNIIRTCSKAFATGGDDFAYYLNEPRAMKAFAKAAGAMSYGSRPPKAHAKA